MPELSVEQPVPATSEFQPSVPTAQEVVAPVPAASDFTPAPAADVEAPTDFLAGATAQEIADMATKNPGTFDLTAALAPRKDLRENPAMMDKFAEAHDLISQSPWYKGLPGPKKIGENVAGVAKGMWESGTNLAEAVSGAAAAEMARLALDKNDPFLKPLVEEKERDVQKRFLEAGAAAEGGLTGIVRQGMALLEKPGRTLAKAAGYIIPALRPATDQIAKAMPGAPEQRTHQDKLNNLFEKLAQADQSEEITKGHGALNKAIGSEVLKDIEAHGQAVDPEKVARMEAGEPFSWYAFGKAMKPFHAAATGVASALPGLNVIAGKGVQGVSIGVKPLAKAGLPVAGAVTAGAVAGKIPGLFGDVASIVPGAATVVGAYKGFKLGQQAAESVSGVLERTAKIGSELAGAPTSNAYTIAARNTLKNAPRVLRPVAEGAAMDLGIAATADTPAERQGVGLGLAFGLVGAAKAAPGAAWKTFTGQLIDPRSYSSGTPLPSSGRYAALDAAHNAAFDKMSPAQRGIVNATRFLLRGTGESTDLFAIPADEGLVKDLTTKGLTEKQARERAEDVAIEQALTASGMEAGQAKFAASQRAGAIEMPDGKQIIFLRGTDTLPAGHEARHVIEKSLGEDFLRDFDEEVISRYGLDAVMDAAQRYGQQVGGGGDWVENIINASGKGELEAVTKLVAEMRATADAGRKTRGEPPTLPGNDKLAVQELMANRAKFQAEVAGRMKQQGLTRAEAINTIVNRYRAEAGATGLSNEGLAESISNLYRHWTEILSPEEKLASAVRYTAREIGAENFSAWFARTGGDLTAGKQIPDRIANWIAGGLDEFGINALEGRASTGSTPVELNYGVAKQTGEQALSKQGGKRPVIEPAGAKSSEPSTADAVARGREVAAGAPDEKLPGANQSIKEMLGTLVQAIADKASVIVNYRSAPGQPAAGSVVEGLTQGMDRDARRAIVDAWRYMPEATRNLVERIFSPEQVRNTSKGYQVYGASPQVVAANAQKLAETAINHSKLALPAEYELSRSTRSFTRNGWKALLTDIADYSQNHSRGYTGSGERLNVPQSVTAKDYFAPPVTGEPVKIPQERADVVAALFGYHTPENAIVTKAGKLPLNIVGQRISEATIPGRTTGKKAQFGAPELSIEQQNRAKSLGIEGQTLAENNPFVQKLSNLANPPQFIEAKQWMNLEHMADVTAAPEQPRLAQNTLTAAAGFMTKVARSEAAPTYDKAKDSTGNPWIRQTDDPSNANRVLLVQFSSDLINKDAVKDSASAYYDKLYSGQRPGYARLQDFWEIPQWIGFASRSFENADVYVVRDMADAKTFLNEANYGRVAFSALDVNAKLIKELAADYKGKFDVGGYVQPADFKGVENIKWHDSMESLAKDAGVEYQNGVDYRHFQGSDVIPRLTMSQGCKHKCAFCTVEKTLTAPPQEVIEQQADEIGALGSKLVYLNDKTFGQHPNHQTLPALNDRIKQVNPDFKGFVVQTTASQMLKFTPEYLAKSGIKYVELGIETYNDPILHEMHKPATESLMDRSVAALREAKIALIPNIMIGLPGETPETYARTLQFLKNNADIISHANIYNLAVYKEAELGKKLTTASDGDFDENVLEKSWHTNPETHRVFAGDLYGMGNEFLDRTPPSAKFMTKRGESNAPEHIRDLDEIWTGAASGELTTKDAFVQFMAKTEAGKDLEGRGFKIERSRNKETGTHFYDVVPPDGKDSIATMEVHYDKPGEAKISYVTTGNAYRGLGIAETLYRELATDLQAKGITKLTGDVIHPAPLKIRDTLFGNTQRSEPTYNGWGASVYKVSNEIAPGVQFMAKPNEPKAVKTAAVKDLETGKVYTGAWHVAARNEWAIDKGIITRDMIEGKTDAVTKDGEDIDLYTDAIDKQIKDGFETNAGEFLDRQQAYDRAIELKQINEISYAKEQGGEQGWLESQRFAKDRSFMAKAKGKDDYKLPTGAGTFSKAWILPNGRPVMLGGKWHHEYLNENAAALKKEHGLKLTTDGQDNRLDALRAGFVRVNYDKNKGALVVEAIQPAWSKVKDSVMELVKANLPKVDVMEVNLFDKNAKRVIESDAVKLFTYDDAEKLDHIPLITERTQPTVSMSAQASSEGAYMPKDEARDARVFEFVERRLNNKHSVSNTIDLLRNGTNFGEHGREYSNTEANELFSRYLDNPRASYSPKEGDAWRANSFMTKYSHQTLKDDIQKVNEGSFEGQTYNVDGTAWEAPAGAKNDIVTLASKNFAQEDLTLAKVRSYLKPFYRFLEDPAAKFGMFPFTDKETGAKMVSADVNAVVPQKYRDNSVKFAKDNDQIAIFDAVTLENVNTGGAGNTKIAREGEMLDATNLLIKGKPVDVAEIIRQNVENANLGEELTLPGIDVAKPLANVAKMTKADLKEHFPESVVPRARDEKIASDILGSPLYKQAKNHVAAVKQFASKLVEFARENEKHPAYQAGLKWYSEFVPKLHATYGKLAPIMAELLAATSPNEKPDSNFKMANEALVLYSKGHFDKQIAKFEQGLDMIKNNTWRAWLDKEAAAGKVKLPSDPTAATFINHWYDAHDLAPKKSNGKLFGMNSQAVMKVFARDWLQNTDGPKTQNFVQNLLGTGHEATIDVWADRTMRRMGYSGFKDRWRILPANGAGVSDADFAFGQEAFRAAAKELGILPDALQGALWFAEKNLWRENGWGRLDLGNYQAEFQKVPAQNRGIESNLKKTAPKQTEDLFVVPRTVKPK